MDKEAIRKLLEKRKTQRPTNRSNGDMDWYSLPYEKGSCLIRVLPAMPNEPFPGKIVTTHRNIPEIEKVSCLKMYDVSCPICNLLEEFDGRTKTADWEPSSRGYLNVQVVRDPRPEFNGKLEKIYPCGFPEFTYEWFLGVLIDEEAGGDITDPVNGRDIKLERTKDGGAFKKVVALNPRAIGEDQKVIDELLKKRIDFDTIWSAEPNDKILEKVAKAEEVLRVLLEGRVKSKKEVLDKYKEVEKKDPALTEKKPDNNVEAPKGKSTIKKPSNAPDCYGDKSVYDKESDKCGDCSQEFGCATAVGAPL